MPTTLTPTQQLAAAQIQANNLNQKQLAQNGIINNGNMRNNAEAVLNSGAYPDLDLGVNANGEAVFFIPGGNGNGQGESITPIRDDAWNGTPLLNNTGLVVTSENAEQVAAAQSAVVAAQKASVDAATTQSAADLAQAQAALAAAQARVAALQAQSTNTQPIDTTPTSSPDSQAASSAANQQQGTEISGVTTSNTQNAASIAQQSSAASAAQQVDLATLQAQYDASDTTNTAQSSGSGTVNGGFNSLTTGSGPTQIPPGDATAITPSQGTTVATSGVNEDNSGSAIQSKSTSKIYSDQSSNSEVYSDVGVPKPLSSYKNYDSSNNGQNSATVTNSGPASSIQDSGGGSTQSSQSSNNLQHTNKLHNYTNWTYRISIYAIPTSTINQIYSQVIYPGNESALLNGGLFVASDSGMSAKVANRTYFPTDLTIDNLEIQTIVNSTGDQTRATDVIKMKFDIIEPYTVNFLARLQQCAASLNPQEPNFNWNNSFFCMKIEFTGYNDSGQPISPSVSSDGNGEIITGTTKYIPFTFVRMNFKVSSSGATYSCEAIPTNGLALSALDNQIPFHIEVKGGSILDLFNGGLASTTTTTTLVRPNSADQELQTTTTQNTVSGNQTTVKKGIAEALNQGEKEKTNQKDSNGNHTGQWLANTYAFEFTSDLLGAKVIDPQTFKDQSVAIGGSTDANAKKQGKTGVLTIATDSQSFRATAGTRITDFIGSVITVSDYMTGQNTASGHDTQPVKTWKITPVIKFGPIDRGTGYYQRDVKYVVMPYISYGHDAPGFGQAPVNPSQIVKTYTYIYSGQNKDVIDVNVQYEMAFFEFKNGVPANYINKASDESGNESQQPYSGGSYDSSSDGRFFKPRYHYVRGLADRQNTGPTTVSAQTIAVQELMEKLYDNRGDMNKLDFTIVGDPDWISQDYALMHPSQVGNSPYINNGMGSINFNNPVYFNFYFATPNSDYDDTTGLFNINGTYSQFSGIYRVAQVTSTFSGGKFTQKLKNYRVRNQQDVSSTPVRSDTGTTSQTLNAATRGASENPVAEPSINRSSTQGYHAGTDSGPNYNTTTPPPSQSNSGISEDAASLPQYTYAFGA
jgi:hypothetical protein